MIIPRDELKKRILAQIEDASPLNRQIYNDLLGIIKDMPKNTAIEIEPDGDLKIVSMRNK